MTVSLAAAAAGVLSTSDPPDKALRAHAMAAAWRRGELTEIGRAAPPSRPAPTSAPGCG